MSDNDTVESETGGLTCSICLDNIKDANYGTIDDPADQNTKCCVRCVKEQVEQNKISLIGRNPVTSYTIYDPAGTVVQNVIVERTGEQVPEIVVIAPNARQVINNYIYPAPPPNVQPNQAPVMQNAEQAPYVVYQLAQPQVNQQPSVVQVMQDVEEVNRVIYQLPEPQPYRRRVCPGCTKWMKLNVLIVGIIWITAMVMFGVSYGVSSLNSNGNIKWAMLGVAFGALILGIIIHGILEVREINRPREIVAQ